MSSSRNSAIFVFLKIAIINYGLGNLGSVKNMLKKVGSNNVVITDDIREIEQADKLVLPGVGSFDHGMRQLEEKGLIEGLNRIVLDEKKPILGVCLGAQLMCKSSEEGELPGLGWFNAEVKKFNPTDKQLKIPHMGWNRVHIEKNHAWINELPEPARFYFVHSFYISPNEESDVLLTCNYGASFCAALQYKNRVGMQFHPEKSHKFGMQVFRNFIK